MEKYQEVYEWVRDTFFPRWDRKRKWTYHFADDLDGALGFCNKENKTISLCEDRNVKSILVHEIAHAVSNGSHGAPWKRRLRKAADVARRFGDNALAGQIEKDVGRYEGSPLLTSAMVYDKLQDWMIEWEGDGDPPFEEICHALGWDIGCSLEDFLKHYPRARKVYERAVRGRKQNLALRHRLLDQMRE